MTCWRICRRFAEAIVGVALTASTAAAQEVPVQLLQQPTPDSWPTYHGDYSGRHHRSLTQITPVNVPQLGLAWAFQTNAAQSIKATPVVVNGVIYVSTPDNVWAIDARSGRQLWRYTYPPNAGFKIGHRGVAVLGGLVYVTTPDAHLVALAAQTGTVQWNVEIADSKRGYWSTNAPLIIRNHLIVGVSGDFDNLPGILKSFDPATGALQWTFYSTQPGGTTSQGATGGQMWMTGTYDPELNLLYVGTGNPTPVLNGVVRQGDNKWTGSILALNPDTGTLAWGFQAVPHDTHDWDAAQTPVLFDGTINGKPRKLVAQVSRNGHFFLFDRTNGEHITTSTFIKTLNWTNGVTKDGQPIRNPKKDPNIPGVLVSPGSDGATNWPPPCSSFSGS